MPTELFIVKRDESGLFPLPDGRRVETYDVPPGAMWRCDCHDGSGWLISLPSQNEGLRLWCTLQRTANGPWNVTGEAPKLTVSPSINCLEPGGWHGFIVDGVISDGSFNT